MTEVRFGMGGGEADMLTVEFIDRVFMKNAHSYKAVVYRHSSFQGGFWNGMVTHAIAVIAGFILAWIGMPLWRHVVMHFHQQRYGLLVEQCDMAMQDHFEAKQRSALHPSAQAKTLERTGELGLITCQDYDLYQKRLMQWGLRESELAQMRLIAIEDRASDLDDVVETHEIRY